ncbi:hypothetical protein HK096_003075 [Nowakowskiella sp. JEL0078]|nr:hypothetical protein HK096_003075 [Nowakowskiella sp. JEL0078]
MTPNPLADRTCICNKESFNSDVVGCMVGSGTYCAGQSALFTAYRTAFCAGTRSAAPLVNNAVVTSSSAAAVVKTTTAAPIITTTAIRTTVAALTTAIVNRNTTTIPTFVAVNTTVVPTADTAQLVTAVPTIAKSWGESNAPGFITILFVASIFGYNL